MNSQFKRHTRGEFDAMHAAGQLTAKVLDDLVDMVKPGVTTNELNDYVHQYAIDNKAYPAPLNYRGFPKSICTSPNHVICHGIPSDKTLKEGDILNIDVTLILDGWHGDSSRMYTVGKVLRKAERLIDITYECLQRGLAEVRAGATLGDLGHAIQTYAESERCSVVRDFCGHGIGREFHAPPNVLHYGRPGEGPVLVEGMFMTVEPMINLGKVEHKLLSDNWTAVTRDKSLSAQFEHTIGVTDTGCEIFTSSPKGYDNPKNAQAAHRA